MTEAPYSGERFGSRLPDSHGKIKGSGMEKEEEDGVARKAGGGEGKNREQIHNSIFLPITGYYLKKQTYKFCFCIS